MSDSSQPHGLQHVRPPCPSPSPGICQSSHPLNQWCHPAISSCVTLFSFCLQLFLASGSFLMSQLFISGGQSIGVSASASFLPMNIQDWFPLGLTGLTLSSPRDSQESSLAPQFKSISSSALNLFYVQLSHLYVTTGKAIVLTIPDNCFYFTVIEPHSLLDRIENLQLSIWYTSWSSWLR